MNVTMLLADSAQVAEGKLYILGGGWSLSGPEPVPSAVAIKVEVDTHEFDRMHHWELFLEDADGQLVQFDSPRGSPDDRDPWRLLGERARRRARGNSSGRADRRESRTHSLKSELSFHLASGY